MIHRNIRLLYIFNFLLDFKLYAAILILYFAQVTGSFALGMSVFAVTMVSSALLELPTGIISDMAGRKKTVAFGALMSVFAVIFYAIGQSYVILVIGAIFEGASRSFFSGNNEALLFESLKEEKKETEFAHYSGKISSMFQIALALGSLIGGVIAFWSFPLVMWLSVIPQLGCLVISFFIIEPKIEHIKETNIYAHIKEAVVQFRKNNKLRLLSASSMIGYAFGEAGFQLWPAFINSLWPIWAVGLARTLSHIFGSLGYFISGRIIKRFSALPILVSEVVLSKLINFIALLFPSVLSPALITLTSFLYGPGQIARGTLLQKEFTNEQRATMGSLNSFGGSLLFGVAAVSIGFLADSIGIIQSLLITQVILLSQLFLYWKLFKHDRNVK